MQIDPRLGIKVLDKWDAPRRREFLYDSGIAVWFAHLLEEDRLVPNQGVQLFQYVIRYIPTDVKRGPKLLVCYSKEDFYKLLAHWNKTDSWRYEEVV